MQTIQLLVISENPGLGFRTLQVYTLSYRFWTSRSWAGVSGPWTFRNPRAGGPKWIAFSVFLFVFGTVFEHQDRWRKFGGLLLFHPESK